MLEAPRSGLTTQPEAAERAALARRHGSAWRRTVARRVACVGGGAAGLTGAVLCDAFLVAGWTGSRLSPVDSFVSELEVPGQPLSSWFRAADLASGLLIICFAVALYFRTGRDRTARLGCFWLAVLGAASVADAQRPMPCTPSTNVACQRRLDQAPLLAQLHDWHTLSSTIGILAAVMAMWLLARTICVTGPAPRLAKACRVGAVTLATLACLEVPLIYLGHGAGALERCHVLLISAWLAMLAAQLIRPEINGSVSGHVCGTSGGG